MALRHKNILSAVIGTCVGVYVASMMFIPDKFYSAMTGGQGKETLLVGWIAVVIALLFLVLFFWRNKKEYNDILNGDQGSDTQLRIWFGPRLAPWIKRLFKQD